jgi:hypothetical protein
MLRSRTIVIPNNFSFNKRGLVHFDSVLRHFDLSVQHEDVIIDLSACETSNFQALALLVQYAWYLTMNGCSVAFKYGYASSGSTKMLRKMNMTDWRDVLKIEGRDFGSGQGRQTFALRRRADVQNTINYARRAIQNYQVGFPEYLSYIISELLYNATEHGKRSAEVDTFRVAVPSIFQFGSYPGNQRISFLFSDLGVGVKNHLEQSYPEFRTDHEAIIHALKPNVSGTFRAQQEPYAVSNNAGMGLNYSSVMMKRLKGDMYIASQNGLVHVSPEDVTSRQLENRWPGTFVLINLNLAENQGVSLESLMAEIESNARQELSLHAEAERESTYAVSMLIVFGQYLEDKESAIQFRDKYILPAVLSGKQVDLDFRDIKTVPHSFLNALLATPIRRLGVKAYRKIRLKNAPGFVHEILATILEHNVQMPN